MIRHERSDTHQQGPECLYTGSTHDWTEATMAARLYTAAVFALYQLTLLAGIVLLPVAMVTERFGFRLPVDRAVNGLNEAYDQSRE